MHIDLTGKMVAVLATHYTDEQECLVPRAALQKAGAEVFVIALESTVIMTSQSPTIAGQDIAVDVPLADADPEEYDALILPGGIVGVDTLRAHQDAQQFIYDFFENRQLVGTIGYAPWQLINAGVIRGRTVTGSHTIAADIVNAGGVWVDEEVTEGDILITCRSHDDLAVFNERMIQRLATKDIEEDDYIIELANGTHNNEGGNHE